MHEPPRPIFCFEGFCLDLGRGRLVDPSGAEVGLRPKSFDVLHHFLEAAGRLVSRDELMEAIWPDVVVTDDSITQCVAEIRRALGDEGQQLLRTVPKRGYIFTAEVARSSANTLDTGGGPLESHRISFDTEAWDRATSERPPNGPSKGWRMGHIVDGSLDLRDCARLAEPAEL